MSDPQTLGELQERLQHLFGYVDGQHIGDEPYHKARIRSLAILKRLLAKRRLSIEQVWMVADYAVRHRERPHNTYALLDLYGKALAEQRSIRHWKDEGIFNDRLAAMLAAEPSPIVRAQLMRADRSTRERLLRQWEDSHESTSAQ